MWVSPAAAAINRLASNPEATVRGLVNGTDKVLKTADAFKSFNQDMYQKANQGDPVAHAYMYSAPAGCPQIVLAPPPAPDNPDPHYYVEAIAPRAMTNVHTGEQQIIVGIVRPIFKF